MKITQTQILPILLCICHTLPAQNGKPHPNYIDSIQSSSEIVELVRKNTDQYESFRANIGLDFMDTICQKYSDSLNIKAWSKADFDQNGLTDLLVVGIAYDHVILCVLDMGGKYEIKSLTRNYFQECTFPVVENNRIKYFSTKNLNHRYKGAVISLRQATLIYKFGDFIEENTNPIAHKIEKIAYSTSVCYGECPAFNLTIQADRSAEWDAKLYNEFDGKKYIGLYRSKIRKEQYDEMIDLLNYLDFEHLEDYYHVPWTDDQTGEIEITYDNGKTKKITDYGRLGTFGLNRMHHLLFEWRRNQEWIKAKPLPKRKKQ